MIISSPYFLWALGLLSIPIIIHLFQFKRYRKLYFPDISLLQEAKTKSKSQNQLKDILILLSRLAFITCLILAFSEPIIPAETESNEVETVSIYIDNSFSMQNEGVNGPLINEATQAAFEISESYGANVRLQLVTNDFETYQKRLLSKEEFVSELDEISISGKHRSVEEIISFQSQADIEGNHIFYLISDFQGVLDSGNETRFEVDSNLMVRLIPLQTQYTGNVSIDSAWTEEPMFKDGLDQRLNISITNHGDQLVESVLIQIELSSNPSQSLTLNIPPLTSIDTSINLQPGSGTNISGKIITEDFPITFDNELYVSIPVVQQVSVAIINGTGAGSKELESVFGDIPFSSQTMIESSLDVEKIESADFIVLNEISELSTGLASLVKSHLSRGNNALFIPTDNSSDLLRTSFRENFDIGLGTWDTTKQNVAALNRSSNLYNQVFEESIEDIDLPSVTGHWKCTNCQEEAILTLLDGTSLLSSVNVERGTLYKIASPLNLLYTNIHRHALFVPALINMAIRSKIDQKVFYSITAPHIPIYASTELARVSKVGDSAYFIPTPTYEGIVVRDRFKEAGLYELSVEDTIENSFAINYSRDESILAQPLTDPISVELAEAGISVSIVDSKLEELKSEILEADLGVKLWPIFIVLSLLFLLVETTLLKVLKG